MEIGIPEDEPRNPAVIADNVGDNVGDVAGMGADLYESYVGSVISTAALAVAAGLEFKGVTIPMALASVGILASILGSFLFRRLDVEKRVSVLSGGEKSRLSLVKFLVDPPNLLLMDEPTSALDPISTAKIEDLVLELKKDYTIVMVTHNMQQATRVSDTTAFFLLGDMIEVDDTEKLFSMPSDKRTEDYITGRFG